MATKVKVSERQAKRVLMLFADVLSERLGTTIPTGEQAAYRGLGPELVMAWDWPRVPRPSILLSGGISDQIEAVFGDYGIGALGLVHEVQERADAENLGVFLESYSSFSVSIHPKD